MEIEEMQSTEVLSFLTIVHTQIGVADAFTLTWPSIEKIPKFLFDIN